MTNKNNSIKNKKHTVAKILMLFYALMYENIFPSFIKKLFIKSFRYLKSIIYLIKASNLEIEKNENPKKFIKKLNSAISIIKNKYPKREQIKSLFISKSQQNYQPLTIKLLFRYIKLFLKLQNESNSFCFIDVTFMHEVCDVNTGVQRVIKNILTQLQDLNMNSSLALIPIPVALKMQDIRGNITGVGKRPSESHYSVASKFPNSILGKLLFGKKITFNKSDTLLMMDTNWNFPFRYFCTILERIKEKGVFIATVTYDLIPLYSSYEFQNSSSNGLSALFYEWFYDVTRLSNLLISISRTEKENIERYLAEKNALPADLKIDYWHLGGVHKINTNSTLDAKFPELQKDNNPFLFMIGNISPHKGHLVALKAFQQLWDRGSELNLCIATRTNDKNNTILKAIKSHKKIGINLFLYQDLSDKEVSKLYEASAGVLVLSSYEGFGLPITEAASYGKPIICSDIPVFREIAGVYATYVSYRDGESLCNDLLNWYDAFCKNLLPDTSNIPRLTWKESATQLINKLEEHRDNYLLECNIKKSLKNSKIIERIFNSPKKCIYIDVSYIAQKDEQSGIQRVVKETVKALFKSGVKHHYEIVPFQSIYGNFYIAKSFLDYLNLFPEGLDRSVNYKIVLNKGDILYMLDSSFGIGIAQFSPLFDQAKSLDIPIIFHIFDLLPITHPKFFASGLVSSFNGWFSQVCNIATSLICISEDVKNEIEKYIKTHKFKAIDVTAKHLAIDVENINAKNNLCDSLINVPEPYLLSVGTVEPRKNYDIALSSMEILWESGSNINLCIVGKIGWKVEGFLEKLYSHPMLGKKLFLKISAEDPELNNLYKKAAGLLFLSQAEGFGLPLIEAANFGTPIICSDIPVFKEIVGSHGFYTKAFCPKIVAGRIKEWWQRKEEGTLPDSKSIPLKNWKDYGTDLIKLLLQEKFQMQNKE